MKKSQPARRLQAVESGHREIHQDHARTQGVSHGKGRRAVGRRMDRESGEQEIFDQHLAAVCIVIDDQNRIGERHGHDPEVPDWTKEQKDRCKHATTTNYPDCLEVFSWGP